MLLLVFFLSHVDDFHDKVLKLEPLKQLLSKVNFNLPIEWHGVFIFNGALRYDQRGFVVTCVCMNTHVHACLCGRA